MNAQQSTLVTLIAPALSLALIGVVVATTAALAQLAAATSLRLAATLTLGFRVQQYVK